MAMRGRGGAGVWPVYEDFKPNSEWQQDAHSHSLIISIPGFMREQLRVSTEGRNIVRVRGERLIAGNKWSRFLEDFEVPDNSDMNAIRAKFHDGALTITIPKKTIDKPHHEAREHEKHRQVEDRGKEASSSKTKLAGAEREEAAKEERMKELHSGKEKGKEKEAIESSGSEDGGFTKAVKGRKKKEVIESSGVIAKAVKGVGELNEERKLMVNMGVAILVIVSFSAYVTYKFVAGDDKK